MKVSVFGGSQLKENSMAYAEAQVLGKLLAERGHVILTGGYMGTMEAVSRGGSRRTCDRRNLRGYRTMAAHWC